VFYCAGQNGTGIQVNVGKNVLKIPAYLFYPYYTSSVPKITGVEFETDSACQSIGESAFYYSSSLMSMDIPANVTTIGYKAFYECSSMQSLTIGKGVTTIGTQAFYNTKALKEIKFNAKNCSDLAEAKSGVFYCAGRSASAGTQLIIGAEVTKIPANIFYTSSSSSASSTPFANIASVEFETGSACDKIGDNAFYYCSNLASITIPTSVTAIGEYAFYNCSSLSSVEMLAAVDYLLLQYLQM
jgi:hypothetical protein